MGKTKNQKCRACSCEVTVPELLPGHVEPAAARAISSDYYHLHKVQVPIAHGKTRGRRVRVAVLDSGVTPNHPDNGKLEVGTSFVGNGTDRHGHGTHVAGLVFQVAPEAEVLSLQVLNENIGGSWLAVADAVKHAADEGVDIINMSLGGTFDSPDMKEAVDYARNRDVVIVAASGNTGDDTEFYPAFYENVIAAGACDRFGNLWPLTTRGDIDSIAPGEQVLSSSINGGLVRMSGTSMAAPIVSGVLALAMSVRLFPVDQLYGGDLIDAALAVGIKPQAYFPL